jgi:hypothetical protein
MPSSPVNDCLMFLPAASAASKAAAATTAAAVTTADPATTAASSTNYVCALVFLSAKAGAEADVSHISLLKRKRADMSHYRTATRNALCFFASSSNRPKSATLPETC